MAETISQGERDRSMSYLHATRKQVIDIASAATQAQWQYKPEPGKWSLAEIAEHITFIEQTTLTQMKKALTEPADPELRERVKGKDERILKGMPDRSRKVDAPEAFKPTGRWKSRDALLAAFKQHRDDTIAFVRTTQDDLRGHFFPHPFFGPMDVYQWTLVLAAHADRHIQQMQEVIASPGYPR